MQRLILLATIILFAAPMAIGQSLDPIISQCPTLARMVKSGEVRFIQNPTFDDKQEAARFASECEKVVAELNALGPLPNQYATLRNRAVLAAEFLMGDTYRLDTCKINSVVKLRELVKIPPPEGLVYVRTYASTSDMPGEVAQIFDRVPGSNGGGVRGVTIYGRYIALLESKYHDELVDNLAHEMVHAYITLACPKELPLWFQEGAAVYFSTGRDSKLYGRVGDPKMVQMNLPEDYKTKLYSFQYIEKAKGKDKLFEFVRNSVMTGDVNPRKALGLGPVEKKDKPKSPIWLFALAAAVAVIIGVIAWRRHEGWAE